MFQGKKIIITQSALHFLAGSEIVTLELANFLQKAGAKVTVFTWYLEDPMRVEFKKRRIKVTTDDHDASLKNPDYVWVHHQVLPQIIINQLSGVKQPQFIFFHMSAHEDLYLEQPYIYQLEKTISNFSLFVSPEAKKFAEKTYPEIRGFNALAVLPNFIPPEFTTTRSRPPKQLRHILIVSNHPVKEVAQACDQLSKEGITAELIGQDGTPKLVTPQILKKYDAVISIGKTVQYCLGMGIPIYVYDRYGGCGFLNQQNFRKAALTNFSGRGFSVKTATQIAQELTNDYLTALSFQQDNLSQLQEQFSLSTHLSSIFKSIPSRRSRKLNKDFLRYIKMAQNLTRDKIVAENSLTIVTKGNKTLYDELNVIRQQLLVAQTEKAYLQTQYDLLYNSRPARYARRLRQFTRHFKR